MATCVQMGMIPLGWIIVCVCRNCHYACVCALWPRLPLYFQNDLRQVLGFCGLSLPTFTYVPSLLEQMFNGCVCVCL